jgi:hypothetical protein
VPNEGQLFILSFYLKNEREAASETENIQNISEKGCKPSHFPSNSVTSGVMHLNGTMVFKLVML